MLSRTILIFSSLCFSLMTIASVEASNILKAVLGDSFHAYRMVPYIATHPPIVNAETLQKIKDKRLGGQRFKTEEFDTLQFADTTKNLAVIRLSDHPFSVANVALLTSISAGLFDYGNECFEQTLINAYKLFQNQKRLKRSKHRTLPNFVEDQRYASPYKVLILTDPMLDEGAERLKQLLTSIHMPGFVCFSELSRTIAKQAGLETAGKSAFLAFRDGSCVTSDLYTHGEYMRPGSAAFLSPYIRFLFNGSPSPSTLPRLSHVEYQKGEKDLFSNVMPKGTYKLSEFKIGNIKGVVAPKFDGKQMRWVHTIELEGGSAIYNYPCVFGEGVSSKH